MHVQILVQALRILPVPAKRIEAVERAGGGVIETGAVVQYNRGVSLARPRCTNLCVRAGACQAGQDAHVFARVRARRVWLSKSWDRLYQV